MLIRITAFLALFLMMITPVLATEKATEEADAPHLIIATPKTDMEARAMLAAELKTLKAAWSKSDLDAIHISSYSLEAALTRLEESAAEAEDDPASARLAALQAHVYAMHHAAEDGNKATVGNHLKPLLKGLRPIIVQ